MTKAQKERQKAHGKNKELAAYFRQELADIQSVANKLSEDNRNFLEGSISRIERYIMELEK